MSELITKEFVLKLIDQQLDAIKDFDPTGQMTQLLMNLAKVIEKETTNG
jgi:hypothetical protein